MPKPSPLPPILDDLPSPVDKLGFEPYAQALSDILLDPNTHTPLTLGLFGSWGSGKTSLMQQLRRAVESGRGHPRMLRSTNTRIARARAINGSWMKEARPNFVVLSVAYPYREKPWRERTIFVYSCIIRGWPRANLPDQRTCDTLTSSNSDKEARTILWLK